MTTPLHYRDVAILLDDYGYHELGRKEQARIRKELCQATGFSRGHVTSLIEQHRRTGTIRDRGDGP